MAQRQSAELRMPGQLTPACLLVLQLLLLKVTILQGQPVKLSVTDYVWGVCNGEKYERNSTFAQNYNTVVGILTQKVAAGEMYYVTQATAGADNSSWVYGAYQCRGDLSVDDCRNCVGAMFGYGCSDAIGMRLQLLGCYYRYENFELSTPEYNVFTFNCSSEKNESFLYQADLTTALNMTATAAPSNDLGFAGATMGTAHALSQCYNSFISSSGCSACLSQSSVRSSICNTSSSGFFYYGSCYYLFSSTDLLFSNSSTSPPPLSNPNSMPPLSTLPPAAISSSGPTHTVLPPASAAPLASANSGLSVAAITGISVASALAIIVGLVICALLAVKHRRSVVGNNVEHMAARGSHALSNFTVDQLRVATESFHSRNLLGQGGFGVVYKGTLENGDEVAIKIITLGDNPTTQIDFMDEAKIITTVQHRNLVQLLGYTQDDSRWYLVYEYLPYRSLDLHLFGNNDEGCRLDWKTRFSIIDGIARGLSYLHEDSNIRIVHRDIKASNILLDSNMVPKIADFGLARLFANDVSHLTTMVVGTLGYMAPEYVMGGRLSEKVDVYSFGLLTLEIVSGRRVIENDNGQIHILEWAWGLYGRNEVLGIVDKRILRGVVNSLEVARTVHVALLCTQDNPEKRPTMSQVSMMLRSQSTIIDLPSHPRIASMDFILNTHSRSNEQRHIHSHRRNVTTQQVQTIEGRYQNFSRVSSSLNTTYLDSHSHEAMDPMSEIHAR